MNLPQLILASNSPRRKELLSLAGLTFNVQPADIDETALAGEYPDRYVLRLAESKARAIRSGQQQLVLAADTTVADGGQILGKPVDANQAVVMLKALRGRSHQVYTAVAVFDPASGRMESGICKTEICMRTYTDAEIESYAASGDPLDKAGAYAIQNNEFHPVDSYKGCYTNVMGLPLCLAAELLKGFGTSLTVRVPAKCPDGETACEICSEIQKS